MAPLQVAAAVIASLRMASAAWVINIMCCVYLKHFGSVSGRAAHRVKLAKGDICGGHEEQGQVAREV
jgi:hypothetical protein